MEQELNEAEGQGQEEPGMEESNELAEVMDDFLNGSEITDAMDEFWNNQKI